LVHFGDIILINPCAYVDKYNTILDHIHWIKTLDKVARLVYGLEMLYVPSFLERSLKTLTTLVVVNPGMNRFDSITLANPHRLLARK